MLLAPDAHNRSTCPIWNGVNLGGLPSTPEVISERGHRYYSSRAGGPFRLMQSGAALLALDALVVQSGEDFLPVGQRANLSYWIYRHNLENRLLDELTEFDCVENGPFENWMDIRRERVLKLDEAWVDGHLNRTPSAEDRMLMLLRELIRCDDAGQQPNGNLQMAAGGCRNEKDLGEMVRHAMEKGWTRSLDPTLAGTRTDRINFSARLHVEERTRELDEKRQGFVAMSFDPNLTYVYEEGIEPAIEAAGYEGLPINRKEFTGDVVDEILAEIRKSRFVVADFTACKECTVDEPCNGAPRGCLLRSGFCPRS